MGRHQEELPGATGLQAGQEVAQVPSALPEEPLPATRLQTLTPPPSALRTFLRASGCHGSGGRG